MPHRIQVPGQPSRQAANPLELLAVTIDKTNSHLAHMSRALDMVAANTAKETKHIYALAPRPDGDWGSYCLACSESAEMYVYPCKTDFDAVAPPSHIAVLPEIIELPDEPV